MSNLTDIRAGQSVRVASGAISGAFGQAPVLNVISKNLVNADFSSITEILGWSYPTGVSSAGWKSYLLPKRILNITATDGLYWGNQGGTGVGSGPQPGAAAEVSALPIVLVASTLGVNGANASGGADPAPWSENFKAQSAQVNISSQGLTSLPWTAITVNGGQSQASFDLIDGGDAFFVVPGNNFGASLANIQFTLNQGGSTGSSPGGSATVSLDSSGITGSLKGPIMNPNFGGGTSATGQVVNFTASNNLGLTSLSTPISLAGNGNFYITFNNCGLNQATVDAVLIAVNGALGDGFPYSGYIDMASGTNAVRSSASDDAYNRMVNELGIGVSLN